MYVRLGSEPSYTFLNQLRAKQRVRECEGELAGFLARAATYRAGRDYVFVVYWPASVYADGRHRWIYATVTSPDPAKATTLRQAVLTIRIPNARVSPAASARERPHQIRGRTRAK
jgi:hypothetical protein